MKLFDRKYDLINSTDAFRNLVQANNTLAKDVRNLLEKCWVNYEAHAEKNFLSDLSSVGFHQRCWELYLWHRLTEIGFSLCQPGDGMPDVLISARNREIFIECISPTIGEGENKIHVINKNTTAQEVPEDKIILRITHSILEKSRQAKEREERVGNSHYIIAIDISQLKQCGFDEDFYLSSLYPVGSPIVHFNFESNDVSYQSQANYEYRPEIVKSNNSPVSTTTFLEGTEYSHISAVLFCDADLSHITSFGNAEFTLVHNFKAKNSLNRKIFKGFKQYFYNGRNRIYLSER